MYTRVFVVSVTLLALLFAVALARADRIVTEVVIANSGLSPFVHQGRTYVPVRDVSTCLGAQTQWYESTGEVQIQLDDRTLVMSPYNYKALANGESVKLSAYPVVIDGQMFVPLQVFQQHFGTPVKWDEAKKRPSILGTVGWAEVAVQSTPWNGGPPPWAPAWGRRGYKGQSKDKGLSGGGRQYVGPDDDRVRDPDGDRIKRPGAGQDEPPGKPINERH